MLLAHAVIQRQARPHRECVSPTRFNSKMPSMRAHGLDNLRRHGVTYTSGQSRRWTYDRRAWITVRHSHLQQLRKHAPDKLIDARIGRLTKVVGVWNQKSQYWPRKLVQRVQFLRLRLTSYPGA